MSRVRASLVLLGICVVAVLIGALRLATQSMPLPPGTSYSAQPDGVKGLYTWLEALGGSPTRLQDTLADPATPTLLILQPESPIDRESRDAYDSIAEHGGTLVLAGDSAAWLFYVRSLGFTVLPASPETSDVTAPGGLRFRLAARYRVSADQAEPLLIRDNGDWVGFRRTYKQGHVIVLASADPFTNAGLADDAAARFVFHEIVSPAKGRAVAFDEVHHSFVPTGAGPASFNQLLYATPAGRAVIYVALLTFFFMLLSGRRLGPPVPAQLPAEVPRTMYEHVQMLAGLYRRAGQFPVVRDALANHYARVIGHKSNSPNAALVERIRMARTESALIAAVATLNDSS